MFAVTPSFYLECKLRTNSANASGQTPPKQTVVSVCPHTTPQQLTPNNLSSPVDNNSPIKNTYLKFINLFENFDQKIQ